MIVMLCGDLQCSRALSQSAQIIQSDRAPGKAVNQPCMTRAGMAADVVVTLESRFGGMVVNNTSVAAVIPLPLQGIYNSSKAAAWMLNETLRLELAPFGVKVVDLRTGGVESKFFNNLKTTGRSERLPSSSIYQINQANIERLLRDGAPHRTIKAKDWAEQIVRDLSKRSPALQIWRGADTWMIWSSTWLPYGNLDALLMKATGMDILKEKIMKQKR